MMLTFVYSLSVLAMIGLPVFLGWVTRRHFRVPWFLFLVGAATFAGSQVVHLPLNKLMAHLNLIPSGGGQNGFPLWRTALVLGLSAGVSEELFRAVGYGFLRRYRRFEDGLMMGLGHGGLEAMVFGGVLTAASASVLLPLAVGDANVMGIPADQIASLKAQLGWWTPSPWLAIVPLLERWIAMAAQVVLSMLVWRAVVRCNPGYWLVAVAYHAALDFTGVFIVDRLGPNGNPWLVEGALLALLLPGLVWLWRLWPRKEARPARPPAASFSKEVSLFRASLSKELFEQWRTKRLLVVSSVFVAFGLASPLLARFTPELLQSLPGAEQFAELIPKPTIADALGQYIKNLTQFGFILAIVLGMGAVAGEKEKGTAPMVLSKPLPRWAFLLSKFVSQFLVYGLAFLLAALGGYIYTRLLFGPVSVGVFTAINLLLLLWLTTIAAAVFLGSVIGKTTPAAAGIGLGGAALLLVAGGLPGVGNYLPGGLVAWAGGLGAGSPGTPVPPNGGAVALSLVLILLGFLAAVAVFETQEV